jgi:hypothetical protein
VIIELERKKVERQVAARLIAGGKLDQAALDRVLRLQNSNADRLEALLMKLGLDLAIAEPPDYPEAPALRAAEERARPGRGASGKSAATRICLRMSTGCAISPARCRSFGRRHTQ